MDELNRRHTLKVLATLVGSAFLPSCCLLSGRTSNCEHYQFAHITKPVIDMHAHFFNATDLMVGEYITGPALSDFFGDRFEHVRELLKRIANAIIALATTFQQHISAENELRWLKSTDACSVSEEYNTISQEFYTYVTERERTKSMSLNNSLEELRFETLLNRADRELSTSMNKTNPEQYTTPSDIVFTADTLAKAASVPSQLQEKTGAAEFSSVCPTDNNAVFRILAFAARALARRSTNVQAYYDKYSLHPVNGYGVKHVMNISCDFDFFLGCPQYRSSIADQIKVHEQIFHHSKGFALPVLGVNPWKMYHDDDYATLVDNTLKNGIYKGVKLYPSIGYSVSGEIRDGVRQRKCNGKGINEKMLAEGMDKLISIVYDRKAYITSHTTYSKAAERGSEKLASSKYWVAHLRQRPDLKVNFGHMGDPSDNGGSEWRKGFLSLMSQYENVHADFGYHDYDNYDVLKNDLTSFINDYGVGILKKIAYGSDWYMISKDEGANAYLCSASLNFERAVRENVIRDDHLRDMFYNNAVRFLSLKD
ncbi:amidohydrolase family protein [Alteromonas sp. 345S023]|uniref:Amidohydrolase family protein n=1 Tax=Alteromonas profundi TaxID=2696062 RepID=A0A7X5LNT8_9ALTE|nr:amidohydrolase family protein [Alteromonas profundi]NDV92751.1 amidohydrolase family protein [Alteromonas profundi]